MISPESSNNGSPATNSDQPGTNDLKKVKPSRRQRTTTDQKVEEGARSANQKKILAWFSFPRVSIGIVLLLALVVRWIDIDRGLWLDELHTSWVVADGFHDVGQRAVAGNQAPLYFFVCKISVWILGHHEWSLRLMSLLAGVCLPLLVWQVLRRLTRSHLIPLAAALMIAIDPYFIRYAQEARPYAMLQLFGLLQFNAFLSRFKSRCLGRGSENRGDNGSLDGGHPSPVGLFRWVMEGRSSFVVWGIFCFYIHYTSVLLTATCFVFLATWVVLTGMKLTKELLASFADFAWIGLGMLPMLVVLSGIAKRKSNWELFVNDDQFDPSIYFQLITYISIGVLIWLIFLVIRRFLPSGLNSISFRTRSVRSLQRFFYGLAFLVGYLGPIFLSWFALKADLAPLYLSRYFLIGWTNAVLFLGVSLVQLRNSFSTVLSRLLVSLCLFAVFASSVWQNDLMWSMIREKELAMPFESAWREVIEFMNDQVAEMGEVKKGRSGHRGGSFPAADGSVIVYLFPNLIEDQMLPERDSARRSGTELEDYCCFPFRGLYRLKIRDQVPKPTLISHRFNHVDAREMSEKENVWFVVRGNSMIVSAILDEFSSLQEKEDLVIEPITKREFAIRGAPGNFIFVANFRVTKKEMSAK